MLNLHVVIGNKTTSPPTAVKNSGTMFTEVNGDAFCLRWTLHRRMSGSIADLHPATMTIKAILLPKSYPGSPTRHFTALYISTTKYLDHGCTVQLVACPLKKDGNSLEGQAAVSAQRTVNTRHREGAAGSLQ